MAGNGPLPTGQARRRNAPTIPTDTLNADGYDGEVPEPVTPLTECERTLYNWAWSTPAACGWHWSDAEIVADWARLKALAARYLAGEVEKVVKDAVVPAELPAAILTQITNREDRLYLSPMARKRGRTTIVADKPAASSTAVANVVTPDRWKRTAS